MATGHTSLYNERRERRANYGLADCFGVEAPVWNGAGRPEIGGVDKYVAGPPTRKTMGKGSVVYVPEIRMTVGAGVVAPRNQKVWKLAENNEVLLGALDAALGGKPTVRIDDVRAGFVTVELRKQAAKRRWVLHVLNYNVAKIPKIASLPVRVHVPDGAVGCGGYGVFAGWGGEQGVELERDGGD